ncbi:hypothetical protein BLNAU_22557 [Blattamonas nauphoetae]|uniref:Uncharacterized protein n=1 Tax=Blattamonas nauphoetae TaxID=2049346 RepID=A0ABQ9WSQ1_9EUKA|nr:hypothetical protein BLNAU_22557 [Blattamonas nauphoetae]
MSDPPSTQKERKAKGKRATQAEMEASGGGHQRFLAWSEEAGVGVLMSAEWIAEEGAMDEERVMQLARAGVSTSLLSNPHVQQGVASGGR